MSYSEDFPYSLTKHAEERIAERGINLEWVKQVLSNPEQIDPDKEDPEVLHALGVVPEYGGRVLRVMYNQTVTPWRIVSVHFDRKLKGEL